MKQDLIKDVIQGMLPFLNNAQNEKLQEVLQYTLAKYEVDECFNEIANHYSPDSDNFKWIKSRKEMFLNPTNAESLILKELFQKSKMQESVHTKNILNNRPSADAYLVAKAKTLNATLVTSETYKPHSAQLPNICEELNVKYISYDDFMETLSS